MRVFIGISLETLALNRVMKLQEGLAKTGLRGNFTAKSNIHVTLEFLGEENGDRIEKIKEIIDKVDFSEFTLKITKLKSLKEMVILEVEKDPSLCALQGGLRNELRNNHIRVDDRPYYPHITLVREAKIDFIKDLSIESKVNKITLFSSDRINNRLVYTPIYEREI